MVWCHNENMQINYRYSYKTTAKLACFFFSPRNVFLCGKSSNLYRLTEEKFWLHPDAKGYISQFDSQCLSGEAFTHQSGRGSESPWRFTAGLITAGGSAEGWVQVTQLETFSNINLCVVWERGSRFDFKQHIQRITQPGKCYFNEICGLWIAVFLMWTLWYVIFFF